MREVVRAVGEFGAGLTAFALMIAMLGGAIWFTYLTQRLFASWPTIIHRGAVVIFFLLYAILFGVLLVPSQDVLTRLACRSAADFMACVEDDE